MKSRLSMYSQSCRHHLAQTAPSLLRIAAEVSEETGSKLHVARISDKQYITDHHGEPSTEKALRKFDNSGLNNRFSGTPPEQVMVADHSPILESSPGLYLALKGKNGLYPTITVEAAYYSNKQLYPAYKQGVSLGEYWDPNTILPAEKIVVVYETGSPIRFVNLSRPEIVKKFELVLQESLICYRNFLKEKFNDFELRNQILNELDIRNLMDKSDNIPLSFSSAINMEDDYLISQLVGNFLLRHGFAIRFFSRRGLHVTVKEYMEGAGNMVFPMEHLPSLIPYEVFTFSEGRLNRKKFLNDKSASLV